MSDKFEKLVEAISEAHTFLVKECDNATRSLERAKDNACSRETIIAMTAESRLSFAKTILQGLLILSRNL